MRSWWEEGGRGREKQKQVGDAPPPPPSSRAATGYPIINEEINRLIRVTSIVGFGGLGRLLVLPPSVQSMN